MLDLHRLRALHAVVTTGTVKDAATQLGYTPSAISQHIKTLERETGTVLLEPAGRRVRPTAAGNLLADRAQGRRTRHLAPGLVRHRRRRAHPPRPRNGQGHAPAPGNQRAGRRTRRRT